MPATGPFLVVAWAVMVPVALFLGFDFGFIPPLHRYLEEHYGEDYAQRVKRSEKLVPFVY